jgi:hypothetical protein
MKIRLCVDLDTNRKETVLIGVPDRDDDVPGPAEAMACLCEGLCTLIHAADQGGIKDSAASLRDCIRHLENGFADAEYKAYKNEDQNSEKKRDSHG